jgi:hypothetical protein
LAKLATTPFPAKFQVATKPSTCSQDTDDQGAYFFSLAGAAMNLNFGDSPTLVRHSTGGEVERCIGRHGTRWVAAAVLGAAVSPVMLKSATNPEGFPNGRIVGAWFGNYKKRSLPRNSNQAVLEKG